MRGRARRLFACFVVMFGVGARFARGARSLLAGCQRGWNLETQARQRFLSLLAPVNAAKSLRRDLVPISCLVHVFGFLFDCGEFPRNHCVARALEEFV